MPERSDTVWLFHASAIRDAHSPPEGRSSADVAESVLVTRDAPDEHREHAGQAALGWRVLALGPRTDVYRHERAKDAKEVDLAGSVILPAFVNAHTHLDLTPIGPKPYDRSAGFVPWVDMVRTNRPSTPGAIRDAIALGVRASIAGGVATVCDIAGAAGGTPQPVALEAFERAPIGGRSCLEFFGIGSREIAARDAIEAIGGPPALSPHAPNTVSSANYAWAANRAPLIATHVAETPEEIEFVARGTGPQRALLERLGLWSDDILRDVAQGKHPVSHVLDALGDRAARAVFAHVNDCPDTELERLATSGVSVAYCPRASDDFGRHHDFGPHRYREMLGAGVNVALGTDSIINLPEGARTLSTLDEARFLHARDDTDPRTLLAMITTNGLRALGRPASEALITPGGRVHGLVAVPLSDPGAQDPVADVMRSRRTPLLLGLH